MKWFYITAAVLVVGLALTPFYFLRSETGERYDNLVVSYGIYGAKVRSMDPATCGDTTSSSIQGNIFESLYAYHYLKRPVELVPELAESMPVVSEDQLTYTFRLRKGVTYARNPCFGIGEDGQFKTRTVRAEDFVLAFKRIADHHIRSHLALALIQEKVLGVEEYNARTQGYPKGDFSRYDLPLEGVEALDENTLQIRLKTPYPQLVYVLAMHNFAPIPRELIDYHLATEPDEGGGRKPIPPDKRSAEIRTPAAAVGTGAYRLTEWVPGSKIILKRNPDYREVLYPSEGEPSDAEAGLLDDAGKRLPFVDVIHMTFVAENLPAWMLFLTKQADVSGIPSNVFNQVIDSEKNLSKQFQDEGVQLQKYASPAVFWFAFNMDDPVVGRSKSLRQAMQLGFDVEEEIDRLFNGRGKRATAYVPSDFEGHAEAQSPYARLDRELARQKVEDAKRELAAAGVIGDRDFIPPITLDLAGQDEMTRRMGEMAKDHFRRIGLDVQIQLNDWPTLQDKVHNKQTQVYAMGWHADYPDPENFLQLYYSPNIKRGTNNTNYSNPAFDRLYERVAVMQPSEERTALYVEMLQILNEDAPAVLLSEPLSFVLVHPWVYNRKSHPIGYGTMKYVRIDSEQRREAGGRH